MDKTIGDRDIVITLDEKLYAVVGERVEKAIRESYYNRVGEKVSEMIMEKLNDDGFCDRVAEAVAEKIRLNEEEYIDGVTDKIKESLLDVVGTIANETLTLVQKRVQEYGFIKIDSKY